MSNRRRIETEEDPLAGLADFASMDPPPPAGDVHNARTTVAALPDGFLADLRRSRPEEPPTARYKVLADTDVKDEAQRESAPPSKPRVGGGPVATGVRRAVHASAPQDRRVSELQAAVSAAISGGTYPPRPRQSDVPSPARAEAIAEEALPLPLTTAPGSAPGASLRAPLPAPVPPSLSSRPPSSAPPSSRTSWPAQSQATTGVVRTSAPPSSPAPSAMSSDPPSGPRSSIPAAAARAALLPLLAAPESEAPPELDDDIYPRARGIGSVVREQWPTLVAAGIVLAAVFAAVFSSG